MTMSTASPLLLDGSHVCFAGLALTPDELADSLQRFLSTGKTARTPQIEGKGELLIAQGFEDAEAVMAFIYEVCHWGGFTGISGRVRKHNDEAAIHDRFLAARAALGTDEPDLKTAIREVRALKGLGLSFASKHLRMLWPQHCPILDSQLHEKLGYPMNATGYDNLARDCRVVAGSLAKEGVANPARGGQPVWYVADVESAVFRRVRP